MFCHLKKNRINVFGYKIIECYFIYRKDYHQVETDAYLPPPAASQAIAARTLQRSQGSSYPPETPPPSYTSAMLHPLDSSPTLHEAHLFMYFIFSVYYSFSFNFNQVKAINKIFKNKTITRILFSKLCIYSFYRSCNLIMVLQFHAFDLKTVSLDHK